GIQEQVLGEGRHLINPVTTQVEIKPCMVIPPGKIGVVTAKVGKEPEAGRVLVNDDEKGIWRRVLTPGLHRLNPHGYTLELRDAVVIAPGYVGLMRANLGAATTNRFAGVGEKGLRREILQPGIYYVNPYELSVSAVEIGINQVTFAPPTLAAYNQRTSQQPVGMANAAPVPAAPARRMNEAPGAVYDDLAEAQQRQKADYDQKSKRWGTWLEKSYSNTDKEKTEKIIASNRMRQIAQQGVEVKTVEAAKAGGGVRPAPEAITFPSKDAFTISLDATIEWELLPQDVAEVMAEFGDVAAVEDKIIIPQSQSIGRLQGSMFAAKDFLSGERRELFQDAFRKTLSDVGARKNIVVHSAFIRNIILPQALLQPIRQRYVAAERELTSKVWQNTKQSAADLQRETSMIGQRTRGVEAQASAAVAVVNAEQQREAGQIDAATRKLVAEKQLQIAALDAERVTVLGEAQADVKRWAGEAEAQGQQLKVAAFGSPTAYTRYQVAQSLPADLKVRLVHTGPGTLWTDLEKTAGAAAAGQILQSTPAGGK
ncbi:MAG: SPFH domain-containing protein, partial [bacterium]|nr:SPFH domain-containing protein [bacterium]